MKVLIVGLGSAGQRHMRNFKRILKDQVSFSAYRVQKRNRMFDDNLGVVEGCSVIETYAIKVFEDFNAALEQRPDIVVIANPNSMHIDLAMEAVKAGCDIFMEKPVSNTWKNIEYLEQLIQEKGVKVYVGFQYRFHPCIVKLKELLMLKEIGRVVNVRCEIGELLTNMHKYEDYREMNESKSAMGGGVILSQIHELDYIFWLFGLPKEVYAVGGQYSELDIDVEDSSTVLCKYKDEDNLFAISIHQDFLQSPPQRKCKIVGTRGSIEVNLIDCSIQIANADGTVQKQIFEGFQRNDMFVAEIKSFLNCRNTGEPEFVSFKDGLGSLKIALAIKESILENKAIQLKQ